METAYRCSGCDKPRPHREFQERATRPGRPVQTRCRVCRREDRYRGLYPNTVCHACMGHRRVDDNGLCAPCNADQGLKVCRVCRQIRALLLDFYGKRAVCRSCMPRSD